MNRVDAPAKASKPEVQKAPQPSVDRVEELAGQILTGDIILPKFQREFVWSKKQVQWPRGIPSLATIRSAVCCCGAAGRMLKAERTIADLEIGPTKYDYPVNYLFDGQQRLSSVCGALYWKGGDPDSQWNIAYDLRAARFFHLDTLDSPPNHQARLNWLSDPALFFEQRAARNYRRETRKVRGGRQRAFQSALRITRSPQSRFSKCRSTTSDPFSSGSTVAVHAADHRRPDARGDVERQVRSVRPDRRPPRRRSRTRISAGWNGR